MAQRASRSVALADTEAVVREIGKCVQRMAERTKDEPDYFPHPLAVAMAEAIRGGNLTDGDGTFAALEAFYQVQMSKANGHFALLHVANLRSGKLLTPEQVLRLLHVHDVLAQYPGDSVGGEVAEGVVAGVLGIDDASSALLLRKAGLQGPRVRKVALLDYIEGLPA